MEIENRRTQVERIGDDAAADALQSRLVEDATVSFSAPEVGLAHPAAWRQLNDAQRRKAWTDLAAWIDWLIEAYRLPPRPWELWWTVPGVGEELSCLRAWHRQLVDVAVADVPPPEGCDARQAAEWATRRSGGLREIARSQAEWHDAMWKAVSRIAGTNGDLKPLLAREADAPSRSCEAREIACRERHALFSPWLGDETSMLPPGASRAAITNTDDPATPCLSGQAPA